ncbi:SRPBCC family protein [Mucilaginibacter antarcticus]|uniref:SRPBCC domain-containing protein n=1 Tax=Mucilaginibacter antarcticus TaxID=1855725 RepID=A0ABW5XNM1_9SPHI
MNAQPFVIEQTYNWPIEKVWSALTDNEKLKQWYFKLDDFKPEVGFAFRFSGTDKGVTFWHRCVVTEATPPNKLAHTWTYEEFPGESVVTWELFDEGGKTRLKLTHTGLETFPQDNPSFATASFSKGWTYITGKGLMEFLDK